MATIDIRRPHSLDKEEAKKRAEELARGMEDKLGIHWRWDGDLIRFEAPSGAAKGTKGVVRVEASAVQVEIDLPFLLKAMKGTVESKVNEKLSAVLGKA
ncbi:polyhydroxyalkanoic acid synthase [Sorangium cellulosum]|uniref:Polyhydroxyalkanoic acid synthase n=1 Tax=Sorangium cellulosum TaxID=56 RepID=A0A2L0EJK5_SORCE|nr:polyhydroxyalkanoic acid system family protein [Sorangium cellulosum]AUX39481.1 polyhydroxyalkanoic acid synthase [Sorangium cellulosum]